MRRERVKPTDAVIGEVLLTSQHARLPRLLEVTKLTPQGCWVGGQLYTARSRGVLYRPHPDDLAAYRRHMGLWAWFGNAGRGDMPELTTAQWDAIQALKTALAKKYERLRLREAE